MKILLFLFVFLSAIGNMSGQRLFEITNEGFISDTSAYINIEDDSGTSTNKVALAVQSRSSVFLDRGIGGYFYGGKYGLSAEGYDAGIFANATLGEGIGIITTGKVGATGRSNFNGGTGLDGWHNAFEGGGYGVHGRTNSAEGYGGYFTGGKGLFTSQLMVSSTDDPRGEVSLIAKSGNADLYLEAANSDVGINFGVNQGLTGTSYPHLFIAHYDGTTYYDRLVLQPTGALAINVLGSAGNTDLCRNTFNEISTCSSSIRYKKDIENYLGSLKFLEQLRPVSFRWKENEAEDIGFIAEEIALLDDRLITRNQNGEVEGVKYDRLTTILVNAIVDQQIMIEQLQKNNEETKIAFEKRLAALEALIAGK